MLRQLIKEAVYILTNEHGFISPEEATRQRNIRLGKAGDTLSLKTDFMQLMETPEGGWGGAMPTMGPAPVFEEVELPEMLQGPGPTPTAGWYEGLDPEVRAGIEEPFERQMDQLFESLAGRGTAGSARAGVSGAAADVLAEHRGRAAPAMAQSAWGMMMPGMMMPYEAAMTKYGADVQRAGTKYGVEAERGMRGFEALMQDYMNKAQMAFGGAQTRFGAMMQDYLARQQEGFRKGAEQRAGVGASGRGELWPAMSEFEKTYLAKFGQLPIWGTRSGEYERKKAYPSANWGA